MKHDFFILEKLLFDWQSLIGSIIGSTTPFLLLIFAQWRERKREDYSNLYYLERVLVDQINNTLDVRRVISDFLNIKINVLIESIKSRTSEQYSSDFAFFHFFPLCQ